MTLDLEQYESQMAKKHQWAMKTSTDLLNLLEGDNEARVNFYGVRPKAWYEITMNMVEAMMYSSGYWTTYKILKRHGKVRISVYIKEMNEEERAEVAADIETDDDEDKIDDPENHNIV